MKPEDFSILYQDTDAGPWDMGSSGSQTTFNNGRAVVAAAREVRSRLLELASEKFEIAVDDLEIADGAVRVKGTPSTTVSIAELAGSGATIIGKGSGRVPETPTASPDSGCVGRLGFESFLEPQLMTHAAHVRVDRETGVTRVLRVVAVHDSGRILNPIGASGQVYGGVVMGIGQALTEGTQLDEAGRQRNPYLLDYKLPTASDAPPIDIAWVETLALDGGPDGSKGMGEPPCVPTAGAIANAIAQATGARVRQLPMTAERVWEAPR
jgi:CO/xanthine dehydrogenase Mo-binding subunit